MPDAIVTLVYSPSQKCRASFLLKKRPLSEHPTGILFVAYNQALVHRERTASGALLPLSCATVSWLILLLLNVSFFFLFFFILLRLTTMATANSKPAWEGAISERWNHDQRCHLLEKLAVASFITPRATIYHCNHIFRTIMGLSEDPIWTSLTW